MPTDYIVRLKCPYGDRDQFLMLENRKENLNQILEMAWDFECPTHGVQREIPVEGSQKSLWSRLQSRYAFLFRAAHNLDVLPSFPEHCNFDQDYYWGNYARMEFLATRPAPGTQTFKPVRPEKLWFQRPTGIA